MQQVYVKFDNADQVNEFINTIDQFDTEFDMGNGRRIVDAKSVIGVFALDLKQPQRLRFDSDSQEILKKIRPFLCEECR